MTIDQTAAERALSGEDFSALPPDTVQFLAPERLQATIDQPRSEWDKAAIAEMAQSIKEQAAAGRGVGGTGILQPIIVRYPPGVIDENGHIAAYTDSEGNQKPVAFKFFITIGETRWRGAVQAGVDTVPVIIKEQSREEAYEDALIENINRNNLSPLDEARAIRHIMNRRGLSFRAVANYLNKNVGYIQNRLDALRVGPDMQQLITERADSLSIARRMDKVRHPKLRAALIKAAKAGATFDALRHLFEVESVADESVQRAIIKLVNAGEIEAARVALGKYRATLQSQTAEHDSTAHDSTAEDEEASTPLGTPRTKGVRTLPTVNYTDALDSLIRQSDSVRHALQGVSLPRREHRETIAPRIAQLRAILADIEAIGTQQEAKFAKSKKGSKKPPK